jgi:hypothetical protein
MTVAIDLPVSIDAAIYARMFVLGAISLSGILVFVFGFILVTRNFVSAWKVETRGSKIEASSPGLAFLAAGSLLMWLAAQSTLTYRQSVTEPAPKPIPRGNPTAPLPPASDAPAARPATPVHDGRSGPSSTKKVESGPSSNRQAKESPPKATEKVSNSEVIIRLLEGSNESASRVDRAIRVAIDLLERNAVQPGPAAPEEAARYRSAAGILQSLKIEDRDRGANNAH